MPDQFIPDPILPPVIVVPPPPAQPPIIVVPPPGIVAPVPPDLIGPAPIKTPMDPMVILLLLGDDEWTNGSGGESDWSTDSTWPTEGGVEGSW